MDSLTQATLGAAVGEIILGKKIGNKGALLGAIIGTLPDLDIVLYPIYSELARISIHRGYSHSIIASIIMPILLCLIIKRIRWFKEVAVFRLWFIGFLIWFTHILLDACTTYGTQLYLPFSDQRISWDIVSIVDPYYTVPLLLGVLVSVSLFRKKTNRAIATYVGILISSVYLIISAFLKIEAEKDFVAIFSEQGIAYNEMLTVPFDFGVNNWYAVARGDSGLFMYRYDELKSHEGNIEFFPFNDHLLENVDPFIADRLIWFSQGFYSIFEFEGKIRLYNLQCDTQGSRYFGDTKVPTAFYFEIDPSKKHPQNLAVGMHPED